MYMCMFMYMERYMTVYITPIDISHHRDTLGRKYVDSAVLYFVDKLYMHFVSSNLTYTHILLLLFFLLSHSLCPQLMTFSQHHLELMSRETYVQGGRSSGRSLESQSNSSLRSDKSEKKLYGLITKEDRYTYSYVCT